MKLLSQHTSQDRRTHKFLFETRRTRPVETVLLENSQGRLTLCLSSQSGCALGCRFCTTGLLGLRGNLLAQEILAQVNHAQNFLGPDKKISNLVFMGMGEPLQNYPQLNLALQALTDQRTLGFPPRRITISTAGILPGIQALARDWPQVGLALSLHSAQEDLRRRLMPGIKTWPLCDLKQALLNHQVLTRRKTLLEVIHIPGLTDTEEAIQALETWCQGLNHQINVIPYHPSAGNFTIPTPEESREFQKKLRALGLPATLRPSAGQDIQSACGQLAGQESLRVSN